jgi:hypothetical protein
MTRPPDAGTDLSALLQAAAVSGTRNRAMIEPRLVAREAAARKVTEATTQLVEAWRALYGESQALTAALHEAGIGTVPPANVDLRSLAASVSTELWRLTRGPYPSSPLELPCICGGQVNRPDMLVPLADLVREADDIVRGLLP